MGSPDAFISSASDFSMMRPACRATFLDITVCVEPVSGIQRTAVPVGWPRGASHNRMGGVGLLLEAACARMAFAWAAQLWSGWYSSWSCC
jgi:hypothetical protein